jgi:hypothetical protein
MNIIGQELLNDINYDPDLLKLITTGDEWYSYDVEKKAQSSQWKNQGEPGPKNACEVR